MTMYRGSDPNGTIPDATQEPQAIAEDSSSSYDEGFGLVNNIVIEHRDTEIYPLNIVSLCSYNKSQALYAN